MHEVPLELGQHFRFKKVNGVTRLSIQFIHICSISKERAADNWDEGEAFFDCALSIKNPPMVPKRLLDIPQLRKTIEYFKLRLPVYALDYWENFFAKREQEREQLCAGCEEWLAKLIGLKISGDKEEKSRKATEKQEILNALNEHRKEDYKQVCWFWCFFYSVVGHYF